MHTLPLIFFSLFFQSCQNKPHFQKEYLTRCAVYTLKENQPIYKDILDEGDITFYGILLLANKDPLIRMYLYSKKVENIWEYQRYYGYSPVDTAWVVEALMNLDLPEDQDQIDKTLSYMFLNDFDPQEGGFIGMKRGSSAYFLGPDLDATSHVSFLLGKRDFKKYKDILIKTNEFIKKKQYPSGLWKSKWYSSNFLPTYLSIRALSLFPVENKEIIDSTINKIKTLQLQNGSISNSILETALAVLTYKELKCCETGIDAGKKWLQRQEKISTGPFLYYWLEEKNEKKFFDCWDKGKIAESFRILALK